MRGWGGWNFRYFAHTSGRGSLYLVLGCPVGLMPSLRKKHRLINLLLTSSCIPARSGSVRTVKVLFIPYMVSKSVQYNPFLYYINPPKAKIGGYYAVYFSRSCTQNSMPVLDAQQLYSSFFRLYFRLSLILLLRNVWDFY